MRKEIIIAIIVGFALGLVITFGIYTANRALKQQKNPEANTSSIITESPAPPSPSPELLLEISEPENNLVVTKNKITVSGRTESEAGIAILAEGYENLVQADAQGVFTDDVPLIPGSNEIKIVSVYKNSEKKEKILTIVYTTAKIEQ